MRQDGSLADLEGPQVLPIVNRNAVENWALESDDVRKEYVEKARAMSTGPTAPLDGDDDETVANGPLELASLDGRFSIEGRILEAHQDEHGFQTSVKRFEKNRGWYTKDREGFPAKVEEQRTCKGRCCKEVMEGGTPNAAATALLDYIRLVLRHAVEVRKSKSTGNTGLAAVSDPLSLIKVESTGPAVAQWYFLIGPAQRLNERMYEATFFEMKGSRKVANIIRGSLDMFQPILLHIATGKIVENIPWPAMYTELDLTARLLRHSPNWTIYLLEHGIGELIEERVVTGATELPYGELQERAAREAAANREKNKEKKKKAKERDTAPGAARGGSQGSGQGQGAGSADEAVARGVV